MTHPTWSTPDGRITLVNADCLDYLKKMEAGSVDCVVTDPPYPMLKGGLSHMAGGVCKRQQPTITVGTPWGNELQALTELERVAVAGAIVFCSWHSIGEIRSLCGGEAVGMVTWYKRNSQPSFRNRPHYQTEFAWLIEYGAGMNWKPLKTHYDICGLVAGCMATERLLDDTGKAAHPTQKPLELIEELLKSGGETVLDPYMGSGTTGVACINTGRRFIGIEIDPKYYEMSIKRCEAAWLHQQGGPMFADRPEKAKEAVLFPGGAA